MERKIDINHILSIYNSWFGLGDLEYIDELIDDMDINCNESIAQVVRRDVEPLYHMRDERSQSVIKTALASFLIASQTNMSIVKQLHHAFFRLAPPFSSNLDMQKLVNVTWNVLFPNEKFAEYAVEGEFVNEDYAHANLKWRSDVKIIKRAFDI